MRPVGGETLGETLLITVPHPRFFTSKNTIKKTVLYLI